MKPWNISIALLTLLIAIASPSIAEVSTRSKPILTQRDGEETRPIEPTTSSEETTEVEPPPENEAETTEKTEESAEETEESAEDAEKEAEKAARRERLEILAEGDRLYQAGDIAGAEALYQQVKPPFSGEGNAQGIASLPDATADPTQLSPKGGVYWREAQAGWEQKLETRIFVPLEFLVEEDPEFIPGHLLLAEAYTHYEQPEKAVEVLERATTFYPNNPELLRAKIEVLGNTEQWLEASIAARQFALLNPDHPDAEEFTRLADENFDKFRSHVRKQLAGNAIGNVLTGAFSVVLTGNPLGALSAVETLILLARGESAIGNSIANQAKENLELIEDEQVVNYIEDLGQKLAKLSGRDDFEYEFYVIKDKNLNAFALPGGKVFVNAGAILHTDSEAELAGLLTHELAHAVLSHGFQMVTHGNLLSNMFRHLPFGGTVANLLVLDYSRDMEVQADVLGTRLLTSAGYAADGLRNLMVELREQYGEGSSFLRFMSSHPLTQDRIDYLESLIENGGYNRFAYEGVERHQEIRQRVAELMKDELDEEELEDLDITLEEEEEAQEEGEESTESSQEEENVESDGETENDSTTPREIPQD